MVEVRILRHHVHVGVVEAVLVGRVRLRRVHAGFEKRGRAVSVMRVEATIGFVVARR